MFKSKLLVGTACSTFLMISVAHAQDASTSAAFSSNAPSVVPEVSVSQGGNGTVSQPNAPVQIPLTSTYSADVISQKVIANEAPGTTAQEVLAREPSIYVTNNGPNGVNQKITFRSFSDGQFSETFDGIEFNDLFNAGAVSSADADNNTLINTNDFTSVQIFRGINNPATNSYNSLGGTINFVPRTPTDDLNGEAGASYGSFNSFDAHVRLNTGLVDGVKQVFSYERNTSNGWTDYDKNDLTNIYYSFDAPLNGGNTNVYGIFIWDTDAGLVNQNIPVDLLYKYGDQYQFPASDYLKQNTSTNHMIIVGVTQAITPIISADVKAFTQSADYTRTSFSVPGGIPLYSLPDSGGTKRDYHLYGLLVDEKGVQSSLTATLPFNTIVLGGNIQSGTEHSREFFGNSTPVQTSQVGPNYDFWNEHELRTEASAYLQDTISLLDDRLKIVPGVKYLQATTRAHDDVAYYYDVAGTTSGFAHYTSPTVSASYELLKGLDAYVAYGQNIKFADVSAYYNGNGQFNNLTNQAVSSVPAHPQPEHVIDYEAGLRYEVHNLALEADYYREDFTNTFITVSDPNTGLSTTTNGGKQLADGVEVQAGDYIPSPFAAVPGNFGGYANFAYNHAIYSSNFNDASAGNVTKGQPLGNVPQYVVASGVNWTNGGYYAAIDTNYIGKEYINNAYTNVATSSANGGYFLTNLTIADSIPVHLGAVKALRIAFNVDNLFGVRYYTQADINTDKNGNAYKEGIVAAPRAFYGSVTAKF